MNSEPRPLPREICVLVVEDDRDLREAVCELLGGEGIPAVRADDGEEALASSSPDCGRRPSCSI